MPGNDDAVCVDIGGEYLGIIGDFASCRWPLQLTKKGILPDHMIAALARDGAILRAYDFVPTRSSPQASI